MFVGIVSEQSTPAHFPAAHAHCASRTCFRGLSGPGWLPSRRTSSAWCGLMFPVESTSGACCGLMFPTESTSGSW